MAEIVLSRELRATRCQQSPHLMFQFEGVVAFFHNVVLMEDVTEKVAVIQFVENRIRYFVRQVFEPVPVVASERNVERHHVLNLAAVEGAVANPGASGDEAEEEGPFAFVLRTFEEVARCRRKNRCKKSLSVAD